MSNTPNVRFLGFVTDWEKKKIKECASFSKGNGYSKSDICDEGVPLVLYGRLYTKYETIIRDVDTFALPKDGSVYSRGNEVIVPASGETAEDISIASVVKESGVLLGGDLNIINVNGDLDPAFLALSISHGKTHCDLSKRAQGKTVVHIHNSDIQAVDLRFPEKREQVKISNLIVELDNLITLHQRKYEKLVALKAACLDKMFPKNGSKVPEVRFTGFSGDWRRCRLGEVLQTIPFKQFLRQPETNGKFEIIQQGNDPVIGFANGIPCSEYQDVVVFGDHTLSLYKPEKPFFVATDGVRIVKGKQQMDGYYLLSLLEKYRPQSEGYKRYYAILAETDCFITNNNEEQKKIGVFFNQIDKLIVLQLREVEKLKQFKQSMLHNMFV